jgi:hypothetical protein
MDTFDKVPSTRGKSYYNKQERDWWHQANLPEKLDYDYSEMESTFMERKTPGGDDFPLVDGTLSNVSISFPLSLTWPCPVPSHFPINLSTLLTLSLC